MNPNLVRDELKCIINSAIQATDKNSQRHYIDDAINLFSNSLEIQQQKNYYQSGAFEKTLERFGYFLLFNQAGKFDSLTGEQVRLIKEFFEGEFNSKN